MGYRLGVDLGTTFVAAARADHSQVEMMTLGDRSVVMPSAVFVGEDGKVLTGFAADRRASSSPERVARQFKRRLGDPTPLRLGGQAYPAAELLAILLREVLARVTETEGGPPDRVTLTHPANWGPFRRGVFADIPARAGLSDAVTITEPEAAALHYARSRELNPGDTVAVYDLGGGTFDATVVRKASHGVQMLGTPEGVERLGGIDFDQALFDFVSYSSNGAFDDLDPRDPKTAIALHRVRQDCVLAKESLSVDSEVLIPVFLANRQFDVRVTRADFEDLIRAQIESTISALARALRSAQVTATELAAVLLVGGSSRIPLVAQMISEELGKPVLVDTHPKYAVALGAATVTGPPVQLPAASTRSGSSPTPASSPMPAGAAQAAGSAELHPPARLEPWTPPVVQRRRRGRTPDPVRRSVAANRKKLITVAVLVVLIGVAGFFSLTSGSTGAVVLLGTDQRGENPFGPSLVIDGGVAPTQELDAAARHDPVGDRDGLYFDATGAASCNPGTLDGLLKKEPDLAQAWGGVHSISATNASMYLAALTPARLRADTRITAFSYASGEARPFPAILQAGTAVLVDDRGLPAVDCATSAPLAAPTSLTDPHYTGSAWPGLDPNAAVEIRPAPAVVREFGLVDAAGAAPFRRPAGSDGDQDFPALPTTGQLDGPYSFTGSMIRCDHFDGCQQAMRQQFSGRFTFSGCPASCSMTGDGIHNQSGGAGSTMTGNISLARQGGALQFGLHGEGWLTSTCENGKTKLNGHWQTTFAVTGSAVVNGLWKATQVAMDQQDVYPKTGRCNPSERAFTLVGAAQ